MSAIWSGRLRSILLAVVAGGLSLILAVTGGTGAAVAVPESADDLLARYQRLSVEAEATTEAMHDAKIEYDKQRRLVAESRTAAGEAQERLEDTEAELRRYQQRVDTLVRASNRGVNTNRLAAFLLSDSPQQLLDSMSDLELLTRQTADDIRNLKRFRQENEDARTAAETAGRSATEAMAAVERTRTELQTKQSELIVQAGQIRSMYRNLTGRQLAALTGETVSFDPRDLPAGASAALAAVRAAVSKVGAAYSWGATGPSTFDCSGLMVWAYQQAGKTIPRSSQAQASGGQPVDRNDLQPGDIIAFYSGATHVGMYVGNGHIVHASTYGVPVQVVPLDKGGPFHSARRY